MCPSEAKGASAGQGESCMVEPCQRDNKYRGQVHLELLYVPYEMEKEILNPIANPNFSMTSLERVIKSADGVEVSEIDRTPNSKKRDVIVRGVLSVTVISVESLPADVQLLILSEGKSSILPADLVLPFRPVGVTYVKSPSLIRGIRETLLRHLTSVLGNDGVAAQYMMLHLLSRVPARVDSVAVGKLSLNLCGPNAESVAIFFCRLNLVIQSILPFSQCITLTVEYLHTATLAPSTNYPSNRLITGALQLVRASHLTFDETRFLFPALGGLLFGSDICPISGSAISLQSAQLSRVTWYNLSSVELGLVVSGSLYGALVGTLLAYPIADFLGRRRELILASLLYIFGGLVTGFAPTLGVLILGWLVYGAGIGLAMHGALLYIAKTAPSQIRGTLISLRELLIVLGILLGYLIGSIEINASGGWCYMFGLSVPIAVLMGIGIWSLPPSPRWLLLRVVQGKGPLQEYKEKTMNALTRLRTMNALTRLRGRTAGDVVSENQIEDTLASLKSAYSDKKSEGSIWEVFVGPSSKAFIIAGGLVLFQQITGQPTVLYYVASIRKTAGFSAVSDAARVSVIIGVFKLLMTGIAVLKVDNLGRRPLLLGGVSGIVVALSLLTSYYNVFQGFPIVAVVALLICWQLLDIILSNKLVDGV